MEKATVLLIKTGLALNVGLHSVQNPKRAHVWGITGLLLGLASVRLKI